MQRPWPFMPTRPGKKILSGVDLTYTQDQVKFGKIESAQYKVPLEKSTAIPRGLAFSSPHKVACLPE